jgi:hypothetical protein
VYVLSLIPSGHGETLGTDQQVAAGGTAAAGYMAKGLTLTKGALIKNTGTIAKICTSLLPLLLLRHKQGKRWLMGSIDGFA